MSESQPISAQHAAASALNKTKELFNAALQSRNQNNHYIAHLKIWEDVPSETPTEAPASGSSKKARYLILAVQKDTGKVTINKAKRNANGSFSIGKDWDLNTLREVQVHQPDVFTITLSRPYQWQTQQPREQYLFLQSIVKVYRKYTQQDGPNLIGIDVPLANGSSTISAERPKADLPSSGSNAADSAHVTESTKAIAGQAQPLEVSTSPARLKPHPNVSLLASPTRTPSANSEPKSISPSLSPTSASLVPPQGALERTVSPVKAARFAAEVEATGSNTPTRPGQQRNNSQTSLTVPKQTLPRSTSNDSIRSGSSGGRGGGSPSGGGGNARARLSSIEPIRGGAAYERMLLAGTGLSGVTEVDGNSDDEDPYGGAVLGDSESRTNLITPSKQDHVRPAPTTQKMAESKRAKEMKGQQGGIEEEEEENRTLLAVEEMLEGLDWRTAGKRTGQSGVKRTADVIEARLLDELSALESANIHAIIESDDRVALVVQHMEEALMQLDQMDSIIAGFKVQLNARADDISHIESQNRGLQVQTSNQRTLMAEIENLINTINVDEEAIHTLSAGRLESSDGIAQLESAAASLYKSMLQARGEGDGAGADMTAAAERLADHEEISTRFCKRVMDYLSVTFTVEAQRLLSDPSRQKELQPPQPTLSDHGPMEEVLGQYCGLLLYMKEVSLPNFSRVSAAYLASASECYKTEILKLFASYQGQLKMASEEDVTESSFTPTGSMAAVAAIRSGTIRRGGRDKTSRARGQDSITGQDCLQRILASVFPIVLRERGFISDLLHINDNKITFADYMDLEPYFRRRAAGTFGLPTTGPMREMKGALDLVFGFLAPELQAFTDAAVAKDKMSIFGILVALDRGILEAEETDCESLQKMLSKLQLRLASQLERFVQEQIRGIEQTKLTVKKRKGVVNFMRVLPVFVQRIESQMVNAESCNTRTIVDEYYNQICRAMFDALQTISRVEGGLSTAAGGDEDKGQMNHLVILIENMCYFVAEITKVSRQKSNSALNELIQRANTIYGDSLSSYTHLVLRRPLGKMMDYGDGVDSLLRSTPDTEISLHAAYSKASIKKLVKDFTAKDTRKAIEALSKRVAKHFNDDDDLLAGPSLSSSQEQQDQAEVVSRVWTSCEEEYSREFERLARILKDCYPDLNIKLELGPGEIQRLFTSMAPKRR